MPIQRNEKTSFVIIEVESILDELFLDPVMTKMEPVISPQFFLAACVLFTSDENYYNSLLAIQQEIDRASLVDKRVEKPSESEIERLFMKVAKKVDLKLLNIFGGLGVPPTVGFWEYIGVGTMVVAYQESLTCDAKFRTEIIRRLRSLIA